MFFVFDGGTGIGHLRRLARIAKRLQGPFSCLIVTGHRAAAHWFVPEECEYIHLPSWDSLLESKARYWGRRPFLLLEESEALLLRKKILSAVVEAFVPDVIFVDHLPLGMREELADIINQTRCVKYLVTRGLLNESDNLRHLTLGRKAQDYLRSYYHKILVASDKRVVDFSKQYEVSSDIGAKTVHTGYIAESVPPDIIKRTRDERRLAKDDIWVVASAGGGQRGEELIEACLNLANHRKDIVFDIVVGPRSGLPWKEDHTLIIRENIRLHKEVTHMPFLHASADLVISSGGYNSLLEALQGNAKILCFPFWKDQRDEQFQHATSLKKFVGIEVSTDVSDLPGLFERAVSSLDGNGAQDRRRELDFNGVANIERIVLRDIALDS